jgi:hypothetical protein
MLEYFAPCYHNADKRKKEKEKMHQVLAGKRIIK